MQTLLSRGKIRAIGVSNFSVDQMERFRRVAPIHVLQSPYNLFEREIEDGGLAVLSGEQHRNVRLRRVVPRPAVRTYAEGDGVRGRRSAARRPEIPGAAGSINILPPRNGSISSRGGVSVSGSSTWRLDGCLTRASPRRCGARDSADQLQPVDRGHGLAPRCVRDG